MIRLLSYKCEIDVAQFGPHQRRQIADMIIKYKWFFLSFKLLNGNGH